MQMMGGAASKLRSVHTDSSRVRECQQRQASSKELPTHCHVCVKAKAVAVDVVVGVSRFFTKEWSPPRFSPANPNVISWTGPDKSWFRPRKLRHIYVRRRSTCFHTSRGIKNE